MYFFNNYNFSPHNSCAKINCLFFFLIQVFSLAKSQFASGESSISPAFRVSSPSFGRTEIWRVYVLPKSRSRPKTFSILAATLLSFSFIVCSLVESFSLWGPKMLWMGRDTFTAGFPTEGRFHHRFSHLLLRFSQADILQPYNHIGRSWTPVCYS